MDRNFLAERFGEVYTEDPVRLPLPERLMVGYYPPTRCWASGGSKTSINQCFRGEEFFQRQQVFDRSSLTRWRTRIGEERLAAPIQEILSVATRTKAIKPSEL